MKDPQISVIIVTYNSAKYLPVCLNSLFDTKYSNLEIIVVDNNSSDDTIPIINSFKEKIVLIRSNKNLGFAEGNNLGIKSAKGEFVFLINPDTSVDKNIFTNLLKAFDCDLKVAVAQPAVYLMKDPKKLNLTGKVTNFLGFDWVRDYQKQTVPERGEIISFSGCGVMIKKSILQKTNAFDPKYFMYYEDSDLSWRIRLFGFKIMFVPDAIMYHDYKYVPIESYLSLKKKLFLNERNRIMTIYKNYSARTIFLLLPAIFLLELCMIIFSILSGWFLEKIKGYLSVIKLRNSLDQDRKFIQQKRLVSDTQISSNFVSTLNIEIYDSWGVRLFINPFLFCYWKLVKYLI